MRGRSPGGARILAVGLAAAGLLAGAPRAAAQALDDDALEPLRHGAPPLAPLGPAPSAPEADERADDVPPSARRERQYVLHNTWEGSVGGMRVVDAGSGAPGSFRVQLAGSFFALDGWLEPPGPELYFGGALSVGWTPFDALEIYGSVASSWLDTEALGRTRLSGDARFGLKAWATPLAWLRLGADAAVDFRSLFGDAALTLDTTSVSLRANATLDLRELDGHEGQIPLLVRLNAGYRFDHSDAIVRARERARYEALPADGPDARSSFEEEARHRIGRLERFALAVDRVDRLRFGVGVELPIELAAEQTTLSPLLEWTMDVPVNRQGFVCVPSARPEVDPCLRELGADALRSRLTLGLRVMPPLRGLAITLTLDVGLTGVHVHARELAAQEPYRVLLGFGYAYDATLPRH